MVRNHSLVMDIISMVRRFSRVLLSSLGMGEKKTDAQVHLGLGIGRAGAGKQEGHKGTEDTGGD